MKAVETTRLVKRFPRSAGYRDLIPFRKRQWITAVEGVDIEIEEGELYGLLGPNGAGKTTLIKILCCLVLPTSGTARVFSRDIEKDEQSIKNMVGLVNAEERSFYWRLTARENLDFYAALYNLDAKTANQRITELLTMLGLENDADVRFQNYSTGMKQKLAIARGLLSQPKLLFVDEPTRSLDPVSAQAVRHFIKENIVSRGTTVILATHNLHEAEEMCDRMAIMDHGRLKAAGSVQQLRTRFRSQEKCEVRVSDFVPETTSRLLALPGVLDCETEDPENGLTMIRLTITDRQSVLPSIMQTLVSSGAGIADCHLTDVPLEEIFINALHAGTGTENA